LPPLLPSAGMYSPKLDSTPRARVSFRVAFPYVASMLTLPQC
jgi:hypothetical protein